MGGREGETKSNRFLPNGNTEYLRLIDSRGIPSNSTRYRTNPTAILSSCATRAADYTTRLFMKICLFPMKTLHVGNGCVVLTFTYPMSRVNDLFTKEISGIKFGTRVIWCTLTCRGKKLVKFATSAAK